MPLLHLAFLLVLLVIILQLGIFSLALTKLGLSPNSAILLLSCTLIGSMINLRLFNISSAFKTLPNDFVIPRTLIKPPPFEKGRTIIAINVGGALIPLSFSLYLILLHKINFINLSAAILAVTTISYVFSKPVKGIGIGIPVFIAPIMAAFTALVIEPSNSAPLAYICGTLGVLIGADLLRLNDIKRMGVPIASIGGAGTFDGVFFTGIIAVLLA